jgi:L-fuconolactonase
MSIIDAHLHLWDLDRVDYPWLTPALGSINRTFTFGEIDPQLDRAGVDGTVLVQAANSMADSASMFAVARAQPRVAGVVAWVDLLRPAVAGAQLDEWADEPKLVGIRHLIHDESDPDWLIRPAVIESLRLVAGRGLAYDVVGVLPRHLENTVRLAEEIPTLRLVIDHLGTPPVAGGDLAEWAGLMSRLAAHPNVFAKVSGLPTMPVAGRALDERVQTAVDLAIELFGADRLLYGGDWPVSTLHREYAATISATGTLLAALGDAERAAVMGGTATRFYRLEGTP